MARFDQLVASYRRHVALPLRPNMPFSQRVWFVVYPPEDERRVMNRVQEFEIATREVDLQWRRLDLSGFFADWMDTFSPDERNACLADPDIVESYADPGFVDFITAKLKGWAQAVLAHEAERTVFAVTGLMELYDFVHVSTIVEAVSNHFPSFPGVLLVFFPGEREGNTYRFLGARNGWNYLAIPIIGEN